MFHPGARSEQICHPDKLSKSRRRARFIPSPGRGPSIPRGDAGSGGGVNAIQTLQGAQRLLPRAHHGSQITP